MLFGDTQFFTLTLYLLTVVSKPPSIGCRVEKASKVIYMVNIWNSIIIAVYRHKEVVSSVTKPCKIYVCQHLIVSSHQFFYMNQAETEKKV